MTSNDQLHLQPTPMLDYQNDGIQRLIRARGWAELAPFEAIQAIYDYVRDDIAFGYNRDDALSASQVLQDGYGQCNTKGTLLMALLRAVGIPARFHGFTIYNDLQKGAIPGYLFTFAPSRIIHSWVEVWFDGQWRELEGYIIDARYLAQVQARFSDHRGPFQGYGIATPCLGNPENTWQGGNTYIQRDGIADDLGLYDQPDDFYREQGTNLTGVRRLLFRFLLRHLMNANVRRIRERGITPSGYCPMTKQSSTNDANL